MLNIHTNTDTFVSLLLYHPDIEFYTADTFERLQQQKKEQQDLIAEKAEQNHSM